jgi:tetratricopeptide (TPR) repeat protein
MEKNNRQEARKYLRQAVESHDENNHEIMRCYALSEYWYGNRSKGLDMLDNAFAASKYDPEIVCNLIELYLLEHKYIKAQSLIAHFTKNKKSMIIHDKPMTYYTKTIALYKQYAQAKLALRNASKREIVSV